MLQEASIAMLDLEEPRTNRALLNALNDLHKNQAELPVPLEMLKKVRWWMYACAGVSMQLLSKTAYCKHRKLFDTKTVKGRLEPSRGVMVAV